MIKLVRLLHLKDAISARTLLTKFRRKRLVEFFCHSCVSDVSSFRVYKLELVSSHWIYGLDTRFFLIDLCKGVDEEKTVLLTPILTTFPISLTGAFRGRWRIWYVKIIQLRRITPSRSHGRRAHEVAKDEFFAEVTPARPEIQMRVYGRESNKFTGLMKKKPICRRVQCERIGKILVEITMAKFCQCQFANA